MGQTDAEKIFDNSANHAGLDSEGQPLNHAFNAKLRADRSIDELIGICKGCIADGLVNDSEAEFLAQWLAKNKEIKSKWPANVLIERIGRMLSDKIIDQEERQELFSLLSDISGGIISDAPEVNRSTSLPFCNPAPIIKFSGRAFCLTGKMLYGSRNACQVEIIKRGGDIHSKLTQETNYLIIGEVGSRDWRHSSFGRKIEYAIELKNKGLPLAIISEQHWINHLQEIVKGETD